MPSDPTLDGFLQAAARATMVWAWRDGGTIRVGCEPPAGRRDDTGALLVQALHDAFGEAAAEQAERELSQLTRRGSGLASSAVRQLIESAEAAYSLLQGATFGLRLRFSAVASGAAFRACCAEVGVDADTMPFERRRDLDARLAASVAELPAVDADTIAGLLKALLRQPLH